jgi:hypothetical protein
MSQRNVERVIGRLVTDEAFRGHFAADPRAALRELKEEGVELNECELWALSTIDPRAVDRFVDSLDARIQKSDLRGGCR